MINDWFPTVEHFTLPEGFSPLLDVYEICDELFTTAALSPTNKGFFENKKLYVWS